MTDSPSVVPTAPLIFLGNFLRNLDSVPDVRLSNSTVSPPPTTRMETKMIIGFVFALP